MSYTIVYRCENTIDAPISGPDRNTAKSWWNLPVPEKDGIENFQYGVDVCGAPTKKLFKLWWKVGKKAGEELRSDIYLILKVPSNEVKHGSHQVAFPRGHAKVIGELCPVTLKSIMY
jgi:hypothetical protein